MGLTIWDNWILMAFLAPMLWAAVALVDACLVSQRIYQHPTEGVVISSLFYAFPLFLLLPDNVLPSLQQPDGIAPLLGDIAVLLDAGGWAAILASLCFLLHIYFYFKTLFATNDVANLEIFSLLSVLLVPIIAFVFLGERLPITYYLAIVVAGLGVLVLATGQLNKIRTSTAIYILLSVIFISLTVVLQAKALKTLPYAISTSLYLFTGIAVSLLMLAFNKSLRQRIRQLLLRYSPAFFCVELLDTGGQLASYRAIDVGPSVSLVMVIECALPVMIMLLSLIVMFAYNITRFGSSSIHTILLEQIKGARSKVSALILIVGAIYTVQAKAFFY